MARRMKPVVATPADTALRIEVDPLAVARGHRALPRGGVHETARRPTRARQRQDLRRQLTRDDRGCRGWELGPLV